MTNEQAKQEAIKKAYGDSYSVCKPFIDNNGWCAVFKDADEMFKGIAGNQTHFKENEIEGGQCLHGIHGKGISFKPKSLGDLEQNNGWIRIEPDGSNLPYDDDKLYKVYSPLEDLSQYPPQCWARVHVMTSEGRGSITHYKPIEPELKPIY